MTDLAEQNATGLSIPLPNPDPKAALALIANFAARHGTASIRADGDRLMLGRSGASIPDKETVDMALLSRAIHFLDQEGFNLVSRARSNPLSISDAEWKELADMQPWLREDGLDPHPGRRLLRAPHPRQIARAGRGTRLAVRPPRPVSRSIAHTHARAT